MKVHRNFKSISPDPILCPCCDVLTGGALLGGDNSLGAEAVVYRDVEDVVLLTQVDLQLSAIAKHLEAVLLGAGVLVRRSLMLLPGLLIGKLLITETTRECTFDRGEIGLARTGFFKGVMALRCVGIQFPTCREDRVAVITFVQEGGIEAIIKC